MATYKVIQDIEAEDKFLGPLTLKQFVFAGAGVFFGYLSFFAVTKNAAILLIIFLPIALLGFFLAIPWSSDQPTEIWVLAKIRYKFKSKVRIWDQAGLEELVTITVPKKIEKQLTNGLDQTEVKSRLKALADTIDSRGWAIKHATVSDGYSTAMPQAGERLLDLGAIPTEVPDTNLAAYTDTMDETGPIAETFNHMIQESSEHHKQASLQRMERARRGEPLDTEAHSGSATNFEPPATAYEQTVDEAAAERSLSDQLRARRSERDQSSSHLKRLKTVSPDSPINTSTTNSFATPVDPGFTSQAPPQGTPAQLGTGQSAVYDPAVNDRQTQAAVDDLTVDNSQDGYAAQGDDQAQAAMTNTPDPAILNLAQNNDLNIDTLARQAKKTDEQQLGEDEVVISLR